MADAEFIEQLRRNLPQLLREHPEVRHELWGIMLEAFPSRQEFMELLQEMRAFREDTNQRFQELREDMNQRFQELREDMNQRFQELRQDMDRRFEAVDRRFEAVDRRFEAVDRRFEAIIEELRHHRQQISDMQQEFRELRVGLSSLGIRVGYGLAEAIRGVVEEFAGESFPLAERLMLRDESGEVYGVAGVDVEFDLYTHNGAAYLVEVKSHLKSGDVLLFGKKVKFAEQKLERQVVPLVIALSMEPRAEQLMRELGIKYRVRAVMS
jgi:hypothetical protein